jgi:hypothetical protein
VAAKKALDAERKSGVRSMFRPMSPAEERGLGWRPPSRRAEQAEAEESGFQLPGPKTLSKLEDNAFDQLEGWGNAERQRRFDAVGIEEEPSEEGMLTGKTRTYHYETYSRSEA